MRSRADLDGVLAFEARAPRFEGAVTLAAPAGPKDNAEVIAALAHRRESQGRLFGRARLDQIEVSYGADERALKLAGSGDVRFGASPLLRAALSARQLDADRFVAKDNKDNNAEPARACCRRCAR